MWRVARQVKQKQSTLLPHADSLFDNSRAVNRRIVQDDDRQPLQAERESLHLLEEELAGHGLCGRFHHRPVVSRQQRETVHSPAWCTWHEGSLISELPRVRHTRLKRDGGFIRIVQIYLAPLTQSFQLAEDFAL